MGLNGKGVENNNACPGSRVKELVSKPFKDTLPMLIHQLLVVRNQLFQHILDLGLHPQAGRVLVTTPCKV